MKRRLLFTLLTALGLAQSASAQFTPGNLVVEQVGSGSGALTSASTALFLKEYTPAGNPSGFTVTIPSTGSNALTSSGSATSEGFVTRTADGSGLVVAGYNSAAGVASIASTNSSSTPRGVGSISATGTYSLAATTNSFFNGNNIRSATGDGLGNYWAAGGNSGVIYLPAGSTTGTAIATTTTNIRSIAAFNNQLYYSTGSGTTGIYKVGTGLPTTAGQTATLLFSVSSPYAFAFNAAGDVCYVADDALGIRKYTYNGTAWAFAYTLNSTAVRGLAADFSGTNPVVYATTAAATSIIKVTDAGAANATATTLVTAPTNTAFRGLALAPASAAIPGSFTVTNQSGLTALTANQGVASAPGSFKLAASNLSNNVTIAPSSASFEVATSSAGPYSASLTVTQSGGSLPGQPVTIYVRLAATAPVGPSSGTVNITSNGTPAASVNVSGTVTGPMLTASPSTLGGFNAVLSAPSTTQSFTITGTNLTANATATLSGPFEFSTEGVTFTTSPLTLVQSAGGLSQMIYVRIPANSTIGTVSGAVTVTSGSASAVVSLGGQVSKPFTAGNLVIARVGDGVTTMANTGNAVFLDEYTLTGTLVQTIALPTTVAGNNKRLVLSGSATSEGFITRSADGRFLTLAGYDATPPYASSLAGTSGAAVGRSIAVVDYKGFVDLTTALNDFATGNNPRAAFTTNGTDLWAVGGAGGVRYATKSTVGASTQVSAAASVANIRTLNYAEYGTNNGQLFIGTGSGSGTHVAKVGTGTPTTTNNTIDNLPGVSTSASVYQFFFADLNDAVAGVDVLYTANDPGGITKYSFDGTTWTSNGTIDASAVSYRGLTGKVGADSTVMLYGVRGFAGTYTDSGELVVITDNTGWNAAPAGATIVPVVTKNLGSKVRFSGVALAPVNNTCAGDMKVWQGNASASYGFGGNWCGGTAPVASSNVTIQPNGFYLPRLTSGLQAVNNLEIQNSAALGVYSNATLEVHGNITNNGAFNTESGKLSFMGAGAQNIPALTASTVTFNGAGFALAGDVTATNSMDFASGIVTLGANNLIAAQGATITGGSATSYVRTTGSGSLKAYVAATPVKFPVGLFSYNPATLANNGVTATETGFSVRVFENVLEDGTTGSPVSNPVVNRTWLIDEDGTGTADATLTLQWNNGETTAGFQPEHVYIAHYNTTTNSWEATVPDASQAPAAGGYPGAGPFTATASGLTSFSPFTVASNTASGSPLPVVISQLTVTNDGAANQLMWRSYTEEPGLRYRAEYSQDGRTFSGVAEIAAAGRAEQYTLTHQPGTEGAHYYRIALLNSDGTIAYSNIAAVRTGAGTQVVSVFPNPATQAFQVSITGAVSADAALTLMDAGGRVVRSEAISGRVTAVDVRGLPAGVYSLRVVNGDHVELYRVVKQ